MKIITTKTQELSYGANRILKVILLKNSPKTLSLAAERIEITKQLTKGEKHFVMVDTRANKSALKDVRSFFSKKNEAEKRIAQAYIVKSIANKVIGNLYLNFKKPIIPTRMFSNEKEATNWFSNLIYLSETNNYKMAKRAFSSKSFL